MRTGIVAFLIGNFSLLYWPLSFSFLNYGQLKSNFPPIQTVLFVVCLFLVVVFSLYKARLFFVSSSIHIYQIFFKKTTIVISAFFLGFSYTLFYVSYLYPVLDLKQIEGKTIDIKGYIDSIPNKSDDKQSFEFYVTSRKLLSNTGNNQKDDQWEQSFNGKIRLSWYHTYEQLKSGQEWQLKVRLKRPNGLLNGNFDYEKWLYQNRILATGYIREGKLLKPSSLSFIKTHVISLRQQVSSRIDNVLTDYAYKGLVKALAIGIRHDIEVEQWRAFLRTGTNHLIAISGLHIGLMSSLIWFIVYNLWRSFTWLNLKVPAFFVASFTALCTAVIYAALAGFAIPTQRALIMLSVVFLAIILKREFLPSYILLFAFLLVVIFDPLSALSPGFWLSFGAVAVILLTVSSRLAKMQGTSDKLKQLGWLQITIFIGLLAPLLILFHQFSLVAPLANILAVPLMSFIVVPMILLATGLLFIYEPLAFLLFKLLEWPINFLFWSLDYLSQWTESLIYIPETPIIVLVMVLMGSLWLLMPKGWHGRWLGVLLILPVFFVEAEKIPEGQIQLTMLDVGQGLAMVLRTRHHTLLYDTGDYYSDQFNMADQVIIPYFRVKGIKKIDKLIVSHSDKDHAGSYSQIIHQIPIKNVLAGEPEQLSVKSSSNLMNTGMKSKRTFFSINQCASGQNWQWDGVNFEVLSPNRPLLVKKRNNRSCVLRVTTASNKVILLTGDIEKKTEKQLLSAYPELKADILQVPHHGSKTSSSFKFLKQLQPKVALFSFGYKNRFHHPASQVIERYKKMQVKLYNTSNGAIDIKSNMTNNSFSVKEYRVEYQQLWNREIMEL
ncbi:MAG: DNA internalization-related competence protein ComEC/Rec2 [Gammaproteobacteria bacterium]|nr:DNA internalization-related competence protein ComEC/Rec2 [Gammaproteobacteria bacterium]